MNNWYKINNTEDLISPSLIVYPDRVKKNIQMMIEIAGGTDHLRPHIKTHKIAEIIKLQMDAGITKFKCATIAEAELLAKCGAIDILLAMQPVVTNMTRFISLIKAYPDAVFSTIVDNPDTIAVFSKIASSGGIKIPLWLDINNGMNRTGIEPGKEAVKIYQAIYNDKNLIAKGLHVYDGHIHNSDIDERTEVCNRDFAPVLKLKEDIEQSGIIIETIVAGGTPTFPIHKQRKGVEVSPGTPLLWDEGYAKRYKDLDFLQAAVLLTRVISKPKLNLTCFDLGHKSVASEMALPRVNFLETDNFKQVGQSEEHLVVESINEVEINIGELAYAVPMHICPTVAKYKEVYTVSDQKVTGQWQVAARDHKILI